MKEERAWWFSGLFISAGNIRIYKYENAFRWGLGAACLMLSVAKSQLGDKIDIIAPLIPILGFVANIAFIRFILS